VLPSSLATLAAFRLVHGAPWKPAIVLNLGARSTTLLQVTDQRFTARSLALGTRTIMRKTAEQPDHVALEVIATRLAQEITRSVMHFRRQGGAENPVRIHLTGGGARLSGLREALAAKAKIPVDHLDLAAVIETGRNKQQNDAAGDNLPADLAGAAATQLLPGHAVLNLLPRSLQKESIRRRQSWLAAALLVTVAVGWPVAGYFRPAAVEPARAISVMRDETVAQQAETSAPAPAAGSSEEAESFDLELVGVRTTPFPLQVAGYFGERDDYLVAFINAGQPGIQLVRCGHRFEQLGYTLRSFEVRKNSVDHDDAWPVYEVSGFAVLHDEKTGAEVVLDSRRKPKGMLQALLRGTADGQEITSQEGGLVEQRGATYRIQCIQADPPEVAIVRLSSGSGMPETRVLQAVREAIDLGAQPDDLESGSGPNDH